MKVMLDGSSRRMISCASSPRPRSPAQLEHPNIVPVYELGVDENGQVFYTMKMVRGITLRKVLELLAEGVAETVKKYPLAGAAHDFPEGLRCHRLRAQQGRHPPRSQAREHHAG